MATNVTRVTLSLPKVLVQDMDRITRKLGVSRSALVSELLGGAIADVKSLTTDMPDRPNQEDFIRFRGKSIELIQNRLASAMSSDPVTQQEIKHYIANLMVEVPNNDNL